MEICIFYSWQSMYRKNCDRIISKALDKAIKELNKENSGISYTLERGGGDVQGAEHIDISIDEIIKSRADLAIADFTHTGNQPKIDENTGEWKKERLLANSNVLYEYGKLEATLNPRQVFKVYNTAYGDLKTNLEMPFDIRQELFPINFCCSDVTSPDDREKATEGLKKDIKSIIRQGTEEFLNNQTVRFSPLVPLRNEYKKALYNTTFSPVKCFNEIRERIEKGLSFRLLGLPGLGKTRMVGEGFRGNDNDVYYCDCKTTQSQTVQNAVERLLTQRTKSKQIVILDNCDQKLCGYTTDMLHENGYNCQLITIHYDPSEKADTGIEVVSLKVEDSVETVNAMVNAVQDMPGNVKDSIIDLAGGFPLMASMMIDNYRKNIPIVNISKRDVFERMLGIDSRNADDVDKLKVLTAFSIFKFIGLYGPQEKQGRFIAGNKIVTNIRGNEDDIFRLFKEVDGQYEKVEILERQGNLVLMRLIPLAIYLCKSWFDNQTSDSIAELIEQIRICPDEGTRNMLVESLSRRITLLSEVPLAKELRDGLTDPERSPFLTEEVVLSPLGSRLFLAFSEVNPEACAVALHRMVEHKSDEEIIGLEPARRNLAWALDHMAFDARSFRNAMLTLARFSLVETESYILNNATGLFVDRFAILLPGTEVNLKARLDIIEELACDSRYTGLIKRSLLRGLRSGHFNRSGGSEKQGTKTLKDYVPSLAEVKDYYSACLNMLLDNANSTADEEDIAKALVENARGYYMSGLEGFLFDGLELMAPKKDFVWEEMKEALAYIIQYDTKKRGDIHADEIRLWQSKLTKDDYVYKLLHLETEILRHYNLSHEESMKLIAEQYRAMAKELVDNHLYQNNDIVAGIFSGKGFLFSRFGVELSQYSKSKGIQNEILDVILKQVLNEETSREGESLLTYFLIDVDDKNVLAEVYDTILESKKKYLLVAAYAIKAEDEQRLSQLFELLDKGELHINDFALYFSHRTLNDYDVKYVAERLLNYGSEGASMVLTYCHNLFFNENTTDDDYLKLGRQCLMSIDLQSIKMNDYLYFESMNNYLVLKHDEEMALHVQHLMEKSFETVSLCDDYYLGRLYRKVLLQYSYLLKGKLLDLLDDADSSDQWIKLLRTSYPQDNENEPTYRFMSEDDWFDWLEAGKDKKRSYVLAMLFNYAEDNGVSPVYLRLINGYWNEDIRAALSSRFHSFSWAGSGIPLYMSRIRICEDYIKKVTNEDARKWFQKDIEFWKNQIEQERLQNAHERAIYD